MGKNGKLCHGKYEEGCSQIILKGNVWLDIYGLIILRYMLVIGIFVISLFMLPATIVDERRLMFFEYLTLLITSLFILRKFIRIDQYYNSMSHKVYTREIYDKVEDLHKSWFYEGSQVKEMNNFWIGIILGILISILLGSLFGLLSNQFESRESSTIINNYNTTFNLTFSDLNLEIVHKQYLIFESFYLLSLMLLAGACIYLLMIIFFINNADSLECKRIIKYKIKMEKLSIFGLAKKIKNKLTKDIKNKWIKVDIKSRNDTEIILVYHKVKRWISEKVNVLKITPNKIYISYSSSKMGGRIGSLFNKCIASLENNRIIEKVRD